MEEDRIENAFEEEVETLESENKPEPSVYTITPTTLVNLREEPRDDAAVVAHAVGGHVYTNATKYNDEWYEIPYGRQYNLYAKAQFMKVLEVVYK